MNSIHHAIAHLPAKTLRAMILTVPSSTRAVSCSTAVAHGRTIRLDVQPSFIGNTRLAIAQFDSSGHAITLADASFRGGSEAPVIESASVQFDPSGTARGGLGQYLTPEDFSKDSSGALHPRWTKPPFRPLTRGQLAQAERLTAWLWRACRMGA